MTEISADKPDLSVDLNGLKLKNPVTAASGTFGFGEEYDDYIDPNLPGAISVKGLTPEAREGNPPPRIAETPAGMLNAIGLQNPGVDQFISEKLPSLVNYDCKIIANISADSVEGFSNMAAKLDGTEVDALELNISCPNVRKGGIAFGREPETAAEVVRQAKKSTSLPIITKLTPNTGRITEVAAAVEAAGSDAISLINTMPAMKIDVEKEDPILNNITGGLSGPAIRPVAVYMVYQVARTVDLPLIGMGGITCTRDAVEFFLAGARAVAVGTGNFANPEAIEEILEGIKRCLMRKGYKNLRMLEGRIFNE